MYLLKELGYDNYACQFNVTNGIKVMFPKNAEAMVMGTFWGESELIIEKSIDVNQFKSEGKENFQLVNYANTYFVKDMKDSYKKIIFDISSPQTEKIDGYIIFVMNSSKSIESDGEILFARYPTERVAVLREGQYLKYDGGLVKVINGQLWHTI